MFHTTIKNHHTFFPLINDHNFYQNQQRKCFLKAKIFSTFFSAKQVFSFHHTKTNSSPSMKQIGSKQNLERQSSCTPKLVSTHNYGNMKF